MKILFTSILCVASFFELWAQDIPTGARSAGMGRAGVTLTDGWSIFQNIGGLGGVKKTSLLSSYENRFGVQDGLQTMGAGAVKPLKAGVAGIGLSRFGDDLFSIHTISLGYGHRIEQFSLGVRLSQQQYSMEGLGNRSVFLADVGGVATLFPELTFGLQIRNINRATLSRYTGEKVPSRIQAGCAYLPVKQFRLQAEAAYEISQRPVYTVGAEYVWGEKVSFRTGINSRSLQQLFGLGLAHRLLDIDYALSAHASLGLSHQLSLAYHLIKR